MVGLAGLAVGQRRAQSGWAAVVPGGFDQQPAGEHRPGLGDRALPEGFAGLVERSVSAPAMPRARARSKRFQSAPSSRWIESAVRVSIPRNARSRATVGHHRSSSVANCESCNAIAALRGGQPVDGRDQIGEHEVAGAARRSAGGTASGGARPSRSSAWDRRARGAAASSTRGGARSSDRGGMRHAARVISRAASTSGGGTTTRRQRPGQQQPRQQLGVLAIGLDPIRRAARCLARRDHLHRDPGRHRRAIEPEPGRPGLIARPDRAGQPRQPRDRRLDAGPNRTLVNSPVIESIAAACVERAWTSRPTHVIVPAKAGPPHRSWGQPEATPPARQTPARSVRPTTPGRQPATGSPAIGSRRLGRSRPRCAGAPTSRADRRQPRAERCDRRAPRA